MIGTYKFLRSYRGRLYFARIRLEVNSSQVAGVVVERGRGLVDVPEIWVRAALNGARDAFGAPEIAEKGTGWSVVVEQIDGTVADTTEDTIECAAAIAVYAAILPESPCPEVIFEDRWTLTQRSPGDFCL